MQFMHAYLPKNIKGIKISCTSKNWISGCVSLKNDGKEEAPIPNFFYSMGNGVRDIGSTST